MKYNHLENDEETKQTQISYNDSRTSNMAIPQIQLKLQRCKGQLMYGAIHVSYDTIRNQCYKFGKKFSDVIKKREKKVRDKRHLDEMTIKMNGEYYILRRAGDAEGHELDVFLQKYRNKNSAIRFLSRLL